MGSAEAAELTKLAETTYRDVNIALANEFAKHADQLHVDIHRVIDAANSQPFSTSTVRASRSVAIASPCTRGSIWRVMRTRSYLAWRAMSMRLCRAMP
jgi:pyruvate carboxylase